MFKNLSQHGVKALFKMGINAYIGFWFAVISGVSLIISGGKSLSFVKNNTKLIRTGILGITFGSIGIKTLIKLKGLMETCSAYGYEWVFRLFFDNYLAPISLLAMIGYFTYKFVKAYNNRFDGDSNLLLPMAECIASWSVLVIGIMSERVNTFTVYLMAYVVIKFIVVKRLPLIIETVQENGGNLLNIANYEENPEEGFDFPIEDLDNSNDVVENVENTEVVAMTEEDNVVAIEPVVEDVEEDTNMSAKPSVTLGVARTSTGNLLNVFRNVVPTKKAPARKVRTPKLQKSIKDIMDNAKF